MHLIPSEFAPPFRHGLLRRYGPRRRLFQALLICFALWTVLEVLLIYQRVSTADAIKPRLPHRPERLYIASMHWNNEEVLRSHWNDAIVQLVRTWGTENVFVSVYESGSWDDTKGALRDLDVELDRLGVRRNITLSDTTHQDEISVSPSAEGWIDTPRGRKELRRIPYLARLRNMTLRPLEDLEKQGVVFDKILFLNDVVFTVRTRPTQALLKERLPTLWTCCRWMMLSHCLTQTMAYTLRPAL
jgi:hypothetical protein